MTHMKIKATICALAASVMMFGSGTQAKAAELPPVFVEESAIEELVESYCQTQLEDGIILTEEEKAFVRMLVEQQAAAAMEELMAELQSAVAMEELLAEQQAIAAVLGQEQDAEALAAQQAMEAAVIPGTPAYTGMDVVNYAVQFVGNPYVYGGSSLTKGTDCSGFVMRVYDNFGVSLPHSSRADRNVGVDVGGLANAQPGDIVCYSGHVGIYIGNGQIVHASTERTGIIISDVNYRKPITIRRIF